MGDETTSTGAARARLVAPAPSVPARAASRTSAIIAAMTAQLEERRALLDRAEDLGAVTITLRLEPGTSWVRRVAWEEERIPRRRE